MPTKALRIIAAALLTIASAAACKREATGQVAAVLDDQEITFQEINAEVAGANLPQGADKKAVQQAALRQIIERRLMVKAAKADELDKDPEYILRKQRAGETLLTQLLAQKLARSIKVPEAAAIDKYMAERPHMFAGRTIYTVDRIEFPAPTDKNKLREFESDHSLDAIAARLSAQSIRFSRSRAQMDSARVPIQLLNQLKSLPKGEPFIIPGDIAVAGVIVGSATAPLAGEPARAAAVQALQSEQLNDALKRRVDAVRSSTKIQYQSGFSPPAKGQSK